MPSPTISAHVSSGVRTRLRRAKSELLRVRNEFDAWIKFRRSEDAKQSYQQFTAQLKALEGSLSQALDRIQAQIDGLDAGSKTMGGVFTASAVNDLRLAWVQRVWFYFRHKFDQRDDPRLAPVLRAADEVVWSCYKPAFEQSGELLQAAPLPYIEPLFSPNAILRDDPPRELLWNTDDGFARSCLAALPIPIIGVPASSIGAPWLLALLAHEIGHHVQADFDRGTGKRVREFGDQLNAASKSNPRPDAWLARGREVFADVFSVLAIGPATLPAVAEVILGDERSMLNSADARYPAPLVRLALMREMLRQLGLPAPANPYAVDLESPSTKEGVPATQVAAEFKVLPDVVAAALAWKGPAALEFPQLLGWNRTHVAATPWSSPGLHEGGDVVTWADSFALDTSPVAPAALNSPRLLAGAGVLAWARLVQEEDDARREDQLAALGRRLVKEISAAREQKTRAGPAVTIVNASSFSDQLMSASAAQLTSTSTTPN